jgi:hypothetical protein
MEAKNIQSQLQQNVDQAEKLLAEFTAQVVARYKEVTNKELTEQLQAERRKLEANVANAAAAAAQQALTSLYEAYQLERVARLAAQKELNKKLLYLTIASIVLFLMITATFILELRFILH